MSTRARTETEAANLALGHCGQPPIGDLDADATKRARACRLFFAGARDALLREKWWSFAKGWNQPAANATASIGPITTRYIMPADCLRVRYIQDADDGAWDIESQGNEIALVTDVASPLVAYTRKIETVALWDPIFLDGFSYELASKIARKLGRSRAFANEMHALALETIDSAAAIDSKEQSPQNQRSHAPIPSVIAARLGYRYPYGR